MKTEREPKHPDPKRLKALEKIRLKKGSHTSRKDGMCVMEAAAWLAGRKHTDRPPCVSNIIGDFLRSWNDSLGDDDRQMLKPYAARVIGTAGAPEQEERRSWMAMDWLARVCLPEWLELAKLTDDAKALRALRPIINAATLALARPAILESHKKAGAAGAAAGAAAGDAARAAAWDAAGDAAGAAAGAAAWDAARGAAGDAAGDAARAAAWDAVRGAARGSLAPVVKGLQVEALKLLDRMIAVTGEEKSG